MHRLAAGFLLCTLCAFAAQVLAAPGEYEQAVSRKLAQARGVGEVAWLKSGTADFLALYRAAAGGHSGHALIILHGLGGHADWIDVINPLRTGMPPLGWATLSIQLPVAAPDAAWQAQAPSPIEIRRRIEAARVMLTGRGHRIIMLAGYGYGAVLASHHLAGGDAGIHGLVCISMQAPPFLHPAADVTGNLEKVTVPVLDIYGSLDAGDVLSQADDRRIALGRDRQRPFEQAVIEGADHLYTGFAEELTARVAAWLDSARAPP